MARLAVLLLLALCTLAAAGKPLKGYRDAAAAADAAAAMKAMVRAPGCTLQRCRLHRLSVAACSTASTSLAAAAAAQSHS